MGVEHWQTVVAWGMVVAAVVGLSWHWWKPKRKGCAGGCGCKLAKLRKSSEIVEEMGRKKTQGQ